MLDRKQFEEALSEVKEIALGMEGPMTFEECKKYFEGMDISEDQLNMVYQFVANIKNQEETGNDADESEELDDDESKTKAIDENDLSSVSFRMYVEELASMKKIDDAEELALYEKYLSGDDSVIDDLVNSWLPKVVKLAEGYKSVEVLISDLIQEGNMALWTCLTELPDDTDPAKLPSILTSAVIKAMEAYQSETTSADDGEFSIVGKANLIMDAKEYLAKENGQVPTDQELADYTNMTVEEIQGIMNLYKER